MYVFVSVVSLSFVYDVCFCIFLWHLFKCGSMLFLFGLCVLLVFVCVCLVFLFLGA